MARPGFQNFFAITDDPESSLRRIRVTRQLQSELATLFHEQTATLLNEDLEEVQFDGRLEPDDSQILVVPDFPVPEDISAVVRNPRGLEPLDLSEGLDGRIKAIFTGHAGADSRYSFQVFDRRRLLSARGLSIILSADTFRRLEEPGLVLDTQLVAAIAAGKLYFRSYYKAKRVFDLTEYYREATSEELQTFAGTDNVHVEDLVAFEEVADTWVRRKVSLILESGILKSQQPKRIARVARKFGLAVQVSKKDGKEVIVLPEGKRELKALLRFLDEDYYEAPVTQTQYVSNSKQRRADG